MRRSMFVLFFMLCLTLLLAPQIKPEDEPAGPTPKTTAELEKEILKALQETRTPGVGAAIVSREGPRWIAGIGAADVAAHRAATPDTLFRIGSVSKSFVALSMLKLQHENKLRLSDPVHSIAPEIQFFNPWEDTEPVRVVHLLEHTSGFDDLHLPEYASSDPRPLSLREGLELHPHSRTVRWQPGTRYSYANSGPAVAAYLVQKITGKMFEDYVAENFFIPMQMPSATYFLPREPMATLYRADGVTPYPYWHVAVRPSGSINCSVREMANYVEMYLNRGAFRGRTIISPDDILRMETPATTYAAKQGLRMGYGLNNYSTIADGFVYHGHDGGVAGGLARLAYLPEQGIGYVFMINSGNGEAFDKIDKLIRNYMTRGLQKPALPAAAGVPPEIARQYSGYFEPVSPRQELARCFERILGLQKVSIRDAKMEIRPLLGKTESYSAVSERTFRKVKDPAAILALISNHSEGTLIQGRGTNRRIPGWIAWLEIGTTALIAFLASSSLLFALIWIPRKLLGRMRGVRHLSLRVWPLVSILCLGAAVLPMIFADQWDMMVRYGAVTPWSLGLFLLTIAFAAAAVAGLISALRVRRGEVKRGVYIHSLATSVALTTLAIYLAYWGVVGMRTWS